MASDVTSRIEDIESKVLTAGLVIAFAVSLADNVWHVLGSQDWVFPLILLTLLTVLRWLDITRKRVAAIAVGAALRIYDSASDFYSEALHEVNRSTKSLYAVFSHATAPHQHTEESRKYYEGTLRWASRNPGHRLLHRVIRLPAESPDVQNWVDEQVASSDQIENYRVRVIRYPPGMEIEGENFAVIDEKAVFLGFSMEERGELRGFSIHDPRVADAFLQHFRELWRTSGHSRRKTFHSFCRSILFRIVAWRAPPCASTDARVRDDFHIPFKGRPGAGKPS